MRLTIPGAKEILHEYLKHNLDEADFSYKLNWKIVKLSHRIHKGHGAKAHAARQNIRDMLWNYCNEEIGRNVWRRLPGETRWRPLPTETRGSRATAKQNVSRHPFIEKWVFNIKRALGLK
jgi:hypothetical protein